MNAVNKQKAWSLTYPGDGRADEIVARLADRLSISNISAKLLYNRGCHTEQKAMAFLKNEFSVIHDPYLLADMKKGVERLHRAVTDGEKVLIYGDYDVDGVTSVSILYLYLKSQNVDVSYYIPSRMGDGYGLSCGAIDAHCAEADLIVTVDTGITAEEEVRHAKSLGIDMIITDHHECHDTIPDAAAVINPHRPDCPYPFKDLAGVGVTFKLICAYEMMLAEQKGEAAIDAMRRMFYEYADLVAIGTIADVMPVIDENRIIISLGLKLIAATKRKGLAALIAHASKNADANKKITSGFIGYGIAPRINAAGRIENAKIAVELLLCEDDEAADYLARRLCDINKKRQIEENNMANAVYTRIGEEYDFEKDRVIVLENDNWTQGIIGIVASRVTEKYGLPSIFISFEPAVREYPSPQDLGKGSGRSIKGMNLVDALTYCQDLLCKYGGHELAAGLTIERGNLEAFKQRMNEYATRAFGETMPTVTMEVDCETKPDEITMSLAEELDILEPFGAMNPVPVFLLKDARIIKIMPIGSGRHLKLVLDVDGTVFQALYFGMTPAEFPHVSGDVIDLIYNLDINDYQNVRTVQLIVQDVKPSARYEASVDRNKKRFLEIKAGAVFDESEDVIPTRDDFASVYIFLRKECRRGVTALSERTILSLLNAQENVSLGYVKFKFIMMILHEMNICTVQEDKEGYYRFDVFYHANKVNIEKSSILKKLKTQSRRHIG